MFINGNKETRTKRNIRKRNAFCVFLNNSIEITYAIDKNNLFEVYVKDLSTGKTERLNLTEQKYCHHLKDTPATAQNMNIVFIIDTTGSMDTYINGVKDRQ